MTHVSTRSVRSKVKLIASIIFGLAIVSYGIYIIYMAATTGQLHVGKASRWIRYEDDKASWVISLILYVIGVVTVIVALLFVPSFIRRSKISDQMIDENFARKAQYDRPEFRSDFDAKN